MEGLPDSMRRYLREWAERNANVRQVFVFGSRAKGTATSESDLDLALVLQTKDGEAFSELIEHRSAWKQELTQRLGVSVKDIYLADDPHTRVYEDIRVQGVLIFDRDACLP